MSALKSALTVIGAGAPAPALIGLVSSDAALACSCVGYNDVREHIAETDVIFEGIALRNRRAGQSILQRMLSSDVETRFEVVRSWKGGMSGEVDIQHPAGGGGNCGIDFKRKELYAVFAYRAKDGALHTGLCSAPRFNWAEYEAVPKEQQTMGD